jgi:hypothetical protein
MLNRISYWIYNSNRKLLVINADEVRIVSFVTSENIILKITKFPHSNVDAPGCLMGR